MDDRYPLNQANCAFINITAWAFYLVPVILPGAVWLGIAQVLLGMVGQLIVHGVVINIRLKTIYNPGLAAVVLGHVPLGIWYLVEVNGQGLVNGWDWLFGVLMLAAFVGGIMLRLGYGLMSDKNTRYPLNHGKRRGGTGSSISRALASPPCRLVPAPARGRCQLSFPKAAGRRHLLVADCGTAERLV